MIILYQRDWIGLEVPKVSNLCGRRMCTFSKVRIQNQYFFLTQAWVLLLGLFGCFFMVKSNYIFFKSQKLLKLQQQLNIFFFLRIHKLQQSHKNYFSGAIIGGSVNPTEENILLLDNIDLSNNTAVSHDEYIHHIIFKLCLTPCPHKGSLKKNFQTQLNG